VTTLIPLVVGLMSFAVATSFAIPVRPPSPGAEGAAEWGTTLKDPRVIALLGACFCMTVAHGALYAFYTLHLVGNGYSTSVVGLLWTLGVVAEIAVFVRLPWLFQRYTYRTVLLMSFAAATVRFAVIAWGASSLALLAAAQLLHAFTFGTYHAASVALVHRLFAGRLEMRGQALYASLSYGLGGACGMLLAGWMWQTAGAEATFTTSALFGAAGGAIVAWRLRESTAPAEKR
jgi:PPP family 3-phenylpropionic acid transporter